MAHLCKTCSGGTKWYPNPVGRLEAIVERLIKSGAGVPHTYEIRKNICYNLQYLEYLVATFDQLTLSSVLVTQTYKSFVITGVGLFEAIFYWVIRQKGLHKQNEWELLKETSTQQFASGNDTLKFENRLLRRLAVPAEEEMTFEAILRKIEKNKLLGAKSTFYAQLHYLRKLRNKVHLHVVTADFDTDWNAFQFKDFELMKALLLEIFSGPPFGMTKEEKAMFTFLNPRRTLYG